MASGIHFLSFLATLATIQGIHAVEFLVNNTAKNTSGGVRFNNEIGSENSKEILAAATYYIWSLFDQDNVADRKNVQNVSLFIDDKDLAEYTNNNEIHVGARYINGYSGDVNTEFTGLLFHGMTNVLQWNGNGKAPGGLIEGIADFVRLKAGLAPSNWVKFGQGYRWDQGYNVTARFLDYCNNLKDGFVGDLNKKLKYSYNANYFNELLGKSVDQLWNDYKAKYGN